MNPRRIRILVADDIALLRKMAATHLKNLARLVFEPSLGPIELEILEAKDGEAAGRLLEKSHVDLVLLDLMMPKKDGLTLLSEIRAKADHDATKVVILSAVDEPEVMDRVLATGADAYIRKPFTLQSLRETLQALYGETVER